MTTMTKRLLVCPLFALSMLTVPTLASANDSTSSPSTEDHSASSASSAPEAPRNPLSIGLLAGYGDKDAFRTGFGGRIGYTFENSFYLGGVFLYHTGTSNQLFEANVAYGGGEAGYDFKVSALVLRAYGGAGAVNTNVTVTVPPIGQFPGATTSASDTRFGFWPGATLLLPFEDGAAFVGVDAKYLVVQDASALTTYATFGLAF